MAYVLYPAQIVQQKPRSRQPGKHRIMAGSVCTVIPCTLAYILMYISCNVISMGDGPFAFEVSYSPNYFATHSSILEYRKKTSLILATKQSLLFCILSWLFKAVYSNQIERLQWLNGFEQSVKTSKLVLSTFTIAYIT